MKCVNIKLWDILGCFHYILNPPRMIMKYDNHKLQTTPWHREEEPLNHRKTPGRQIKQSNQLPLPHQDDCNSRMDIINVQQIIEQLQTPTMGVTINKKSTTTEPPP